MVKPNDATAAKLSGDSGGSNSAKFDIASSLLKKSNQAINGKFGSMSKSCSADAVLLDGGRV